jgi:intracellular septation protein A
MTPRLRDYLILFGALAVALCLGGVLRQLLGAQQEFAIVVVIIFLALAAVKARWPDHRTVRRITWLHLSVAFVLLGGAAVLLSNFAMLRWWTVPVALLLGLSYCVAHLFLPPRRG